MIPVFKKRHSFFNVFVDCVYRSPEKSLKKKSPSSSRIPGTSKGEGGAGGSRTLVQTRDRYAFYMLIPLLIVGSGTGRSTQTKPYSLYLIRKPGPPPDQPEIILRPVIRPESGDSICGTSRPGPCPGLCRSTKLRSGSECESIFANCCCCEYFLRDFSHCPACLHFHPACCQNQEQPRSGCVGVSVGV